MRRYTSNWNWCKPGQEAVGEYLRGLVQDPASWLRQGDTIWKTRGKEVKLLELPAELGGFRVAVKNYHEKRFWRYFFRPSLAAREAQGYQIVESLGIPCAEVIAYGEVRNGVRLKQAYFITRFLEGTKSMYDFCPRGELAGHNDDMMTLLRQNMKYLATLHKAGFGHGGAHSRNLLWKGAADQLQTVWIDVATVRRFPMFAKKRIIARDLMDAMEIFALTQEQLDELCGIYRSVNDVPVKFLAKAVNAYKYNVCVWK